ncbi:EamA family transporter [Pseudomonas synxantha]|uniref:EamA family transporter n=1 Tax=Pseudomonas synxantha TaxID=47883 RepID=A0ABS0UFT4_9PSED|nr:EamA family transporter [Pseudomonas synxantha]MBI6564453.1 EamA family transporter [Pseudomonas synxantha]MBI6583350.1 EamA family transporter [Pseudomonas synxantha]MDQ0979342.1 drug/metabolite transporter (DMT)-like permease [Pseudomonas synxantha]
MTTQTIDTGWLHGRLGTLVLWALLIATESAGQLFTKVAGDQLGQMDFTWQWLADVARNPGILAAIASYLGAFFVWMLILRRSSLSLAFPLSSLVFVAVLLGSWLGLGEHISLLHWVGVMVIVAGIVLLAEGEES